MKLEEGELVKAEIKVMLKELLIKLMMSERKIIITIFQIFNELFSYSLTKSQYKTSKQIP